MRKRHVLKRIPDPVRFVLILGAALGICMILAKINDDNNPFAMGQTTDKAHDFAGFVVYIGI